MCRIRKCRQRQPIESIEHLMNSLEEVLEYGSAVCLSMVEAFANPSAWSDDARAYLMTLVKSV